MFGPSMEPVDLKLANSISSATSPVVIASHVCASLVESISSGSSWRFLQQMDDGSMGACTSCTILCFSAGCHVTMPITFALISSCTYREYAEHDSLQGLNNVASYGSSSIITEHCKPCLCCCKHSSSACQKTDARVRIATNGDLACHICTHELMA
jgi:hypothetical protein